MSTKVGCNPVIKAMEIYRTIEQLRIDAESGEPSIDLFGIYHRAIDLLDKNVSRVFSTNRFGFPSDHIKIEDYKIDSEFEISRIFHRMFQEFKHRSNKDFIFAEMKYKQINTSINFCYFLDGLSEIRESIANNSESPFRPMHLINKSKTDRKIFEVISVIFGFKREIIFLLDKKESELLEEEARFSNVASRKSTETFETKEEEELSSSCAPNHSKDTAGGELIGMFYYEE